MPNENIPSGWQCPTCGQINAPWVGTCLHETKVDKNTTIRYEKTKENKIEDTKEEEFYS